MKVSIRSLVLLVTVITIGLLMAGCATKLKITKPVANSTVTSPVEVCFEVEGFKIEPAKNGVNSGAGHHHILVDIPQPDDMDLPIGKGEGQIHMGDGSHCKKLQLSPGLHTLQTVIADGNHVPVKPPLTQAITIVVKE